MAVTQINVYSIAPAAPTVTAGSTTNFVSSVDGVSASCASGGVDNTLSWAATGGAINTSVGQWVAPGAAGVYTITARSVADISKSASTIATVVAAPVATTLAASTLTPVYGDTFFLTPTYTGGTAAITYGGDPGGGLTCPASGVASAAIPANWAGSRTYTLTITNAAGTAATTSITVTPRPRFSINSFVATPPVVDYGGATTLSWELGGATTALTLDGISVLGQSSSSASPVRRQVYTLTGSDGLPAGSKTKTVSVAARGLDLLAGDIGWPGNLDGQGSAARFSGPNGVAVDASGNTYVADRLNHAIRKIDASGSVTTLAGGTSGFTDGQGAAARFQSPAGVAVDASGNLYVADLYNNAIRKVDTSGNVTTLAGGTFGPTDGTGAAAQFRTPAGVAVDASGNVYVADTYNNKIRQITQAGVVSTYAGTGVDSFGDGAALSAAFSYPRGLTLDASGNVYVADSGNNRIRKISGGVVSTLAGSGSPGSSDGTGVAALFSDPRGVTIDASGNLYVADSTSNKLRKITPAGVVSTYAGSGAQGSGDGDALSATFAVPQGVAIDASGNLYVADASNDTIRVVSSASPRSVITVAGAASHSGFLGGDRATARFGTTQGAAVDASGNVYVADPINYVVRKIDPEGNVTTLPNGGRDMRPQGVAVDGSGNVYVVDGSNHVVWMIAYAGDVSIYAGTGDAGALDGPAVAATFDSPQGIAIDASGNLYVADSNNNKIRKIMPGSGGVGGTVFSYTGSADTPMAPDVGDGVAGSAQFSGPTGVAVDVSGNLYVADAGNAVIRKIAAGVVSTLAGSSGTFAAADGAGIAAQFYYPQGVAVDALGNVYVADTGNNTVRKIDSAGAVTTLLGGGGTRDGVLRGLLADGALPPLAGGYGSLSAPQAIAVTPDGDLVVTTGNAVMQLTSPRHE